MGLSGCKTQRRASGTSVLACAAPVVRLWRFTQVALNQRAQASCAPGTWITECSLALLLHGAQPDAATVVSCSVAVAAVGALPPTVRRNPELFKKWRKKC